MMKGGGCPDKTVGAARPANRIRGDWLQAHATRSQQTPQIQTQFKAFVSCQRAMQQTIKQCTRSMHCKHPVDKAIGANGDSRWNGTTPERPTTSPIRFRRLRTTTSLPVIPPSLPRSIAKARPGIATPCCAMARRSPRPTSSRRRSWRIAINRNCSPLVRAASASTHSNFIRHGTRCCPHCGVRDCMRYRFPIRNAAQWSHAAPDISCMRKSNRARCVRSP